MNPKGEIIGNMWFGGHKGISSGIPEVTKNLTLGLGCCILLLGDQISVAALGFTLDTQVGVSNPTRNLTNPPEPKPKTA